MSAPNSEDAARPATLGLILAGGLSRRMGGRDKAFVMLAGRPLIAHAVERLAAQCAGLALSANGEAARFAEFALPVLPDNVPGFAGPLAGVQAGLDHAAGRGIGFVVSLSVDTPFAPEDLVARLHEARRNAGAEMAVACSGGRTHHAVALWPAALAGELRRALVEEGLRKVEAFAQRQSVAIAEWPDLPDDPFFNINSPQDLAAAEDMARRSGA